MKKVSVITYASPTTPFGVAKRISFQLSKIGIYTSEIRRGTNPVVNAYDLRCGRIPGPTFAVLAPMWEDQLTERRWKKFIESGVYKTESKIRKLNLPLEFLGSIRIHPGLGVVVEGEDTGCLNRTRKIGVYL